MSSTSSSTRTQVLDWLKEGGLVAVTVTGLLLYFFLSVPATVFYTRLGTSPGEVGITYVSLLSGSTLELLAILLILTAALLLVAFLFAFFSFYTRYFIATIDVLRLQGGVVSKPIEMMTDQEFEDRVKTLEKAYKRLPELIEIAKRRDPAAPSISEMTARTRRIRELRRMRSHTPEESAELALLSKGTGLPVNPLALSWPLTLTRLWIRRRGHRLAAFFVVMTLAILLPTLAFVQAGQVLDGKEYFGHRLGAFGYHADSVRVCPASQQSARSIQDLTRKKLFLLGQNAQYVILYSSADHSTVRVPVSSVMITDASVIECSGIR